MKQVRSFGLVSKAFVGLLVLSIYACDQPKEKEISYSSQSEETFTGSPVPRDFKIHCSQTACTGTYIGPEFIKSDDVAHQFSNKMSAKVGDKLKELYRAGAYCKVDFSKIRMSTIGMGSGNVCYQLCIPFESVQEKCAAFTSFDHSGGWGHPPDLTERKQQLRSALLPGQKLNISPLKKTTEGLQEYWIQWKNKEVQADCSK